ncbi:nucleobase:cation symporter-2 family protein [Lysinibacillus sp. KU-BSD001]|uniref:nucleobase:cation symporter-2 family protein n=1 Tax=Lysinibacillus sp. KU-BSD001 TaxID=3141328 RepID=UPI0036E4E8F0
MNNAKAITFGIQHLLAMYAGAILVPLIIGGALGFNTEQMTYLVAIDILMCGIATLLQVWSGKFVGIGLPVVLGCTFTALTPIITIGHSAGIGAIYGAIIASGAIIVLISGFFGKLVKFFPPVVTGSVVSIIGISLLPTAITNFGGGVADAPDFGSTTNLLLGFTALITIIVIYRFTTGFMRAISILMGIIVGTVLGMILGVVDFTPVKEAGWLHMVQPFYFGAPEFHLEPIITMTLVAMVSLVESTGVYHALSDICKKPIGSKDLAKGYRAEGLASIIGGIFNAFPYTTYSQNVGLVQITGVKERKVIFITGGMLVVLGFLPKAAALTQIIPTPVLGAAMIAMFGTVITQGMKMLAPEINKSMENALIVACAVGLGVGVSIVPEVFKNLPETLSILFANGIVTGSITAIALNIVFNMIGRSKTETQLNTMSQSDTVKR